jgi:cadmium resistance protein CadD (predicted permease)
MPDMRFRLKSDPHRRSWQLFLLLILWLTRLGGALFLVVGLGFFVVAFVDRSLVPVLMGLFPVAFGLVAISTRMRSDGTNFEYGLFHRRSARASNIRWSGP